MTDTTSALSDRLGTYTARDGLNLLCTLLLVVIVIPFVIYAVPQVVGAEQSYVVMSGSMEPTIETGDVVIVNEVPAAQIEEGDVITFGGGAAEPPTTHRVIAVEESNGQRVFRTQGDNNEDPDPSPVSASAVRGRVMELPIGTSQAGGWLFVIPLIGRVVLFTQTTTGLVALILAPFVLLAGSELRTFTEGFREDDGSSPDDPPVVDDRGADDAGGGSVSGDDEPAADDGGFTLSIRVLAVAVAVLAAAGTFAAQRAYETREPLVATVAVGSIVGCLLVVFMIVFGGESETTTPGETEAGPAERLRTDGSTAPVGESSAVPTDHVIDGQLPSSVREWPRTEVESPAALFEMADERGTWVIRDVETDEYVLPADGVVHVASPAEVGEADETGGAASNGHDGDDADDADDADERSGDGAPPHESAPPDEGTAPSDPRATSAGTAAGSGGDDR